MKILCKKKPVCNKQKQQNVSNKPELQCAAAHLQRSFRRCVAAAWSRGYCAPSRLTAVTALPLGADCSRAAWRFHRSDFRSVRSDAEQGDSGKCTLLSVFVWRYRIGGPRRPVWSKEEPSVTNEGQWLWQFVTALSHRRPPFISQQKRVVFKPLPGFCDKAGMNEEEWERRGPCAIYHRAAQAPDGAAGSPLQLRRLLPAAKRHESNQPDFVLCVKLVSPRPLPSQQMVI